MRDFNRGGDSRPPRDGGFRPREGGFRPRRNNFSGPRGPVEEHDAICSECGNECKVPFKPTPGRDVFCKDCFKRNKPVR